METVLSFDRWMRVVKNAATKTIISRGDLRKIFGMIAARTTGEF
jgi:hypothetical protein